jgi:hypothetical protein
MENAECRMQTLSGRQSLTYDFNVRRALRNLPALREIGFAANRRLPRDAGWEKWPTE